MSALTALSLTAALSQPALAAPDQAQRVVVSLSSVDLVPDAVRATVQQDGRSVELLLRDDGSDIHDAMDDRVYTASLEGPPAQYLGLRLVVEHGGAAREVYAGTLHVGLDPMVQVGFLLHTNPQGQLVAWRRASLSPGRMSDAVEALPLLTATAWGVLLLVWGGLHLRDGGTRPG